MKLVEQNNLKQIQNKFPKNKENKGEIVQFKYIYNVSSLNVNNI